MSASHNPGGPTEDWGVKFNYTSGEPAPEKITDAIFGYTTSITELKMAQIADVDLSKVCSPYSDATSCESLNIFLARASLNEAQRPHFRCVQSWNGKSAGVAKRPRELISHPNYSPMSSISSSLARPPSHSWA
jgi:phage tail sheath gpL-like